VERGAHVLVATPGRLNDFLETGEVRLDEVTYVVLDEADRMLDLGFEPQIKKILKIVPSRRQCLMFTATWPKEVAALATSYLSDPCQVTIGKAKEQLSANRDVDQQIVFLRKETEREAELVRRLRTMPSDARVLVFCSTKRSVEAVRRVVVKERGCNAIHGDKEQQERERIIAEFRSGSAPLLIATDVAARGLDIKDVHAVVNYEFPSKIEDYVHRIGRTGRAGSKGVAITFMLAADAKHAPGLCDILRSAKQKVPAELSKLAKLINPPARPLPSTKPGAGLYD